MTSRRTRTVIGAVVLALVATAGIAVAAAGGGGDDPPVREEVLTIQGTPEPDGRPVSLDATLYLPRTAGPAPAIVLAHGFGGSKASVTGQARSLARDGYVVLAYSARGFGASGGLVHVDAPDFEVADGQRVLDLLATRPEVLTDAPGDPRVGVAGASYGGALSLLLAGTDPRVDAIAPSITWNDLRQSLFPQQAVRAEPARSPADVAPVDLDGVFKRGWAGIFFGATSGPTLTTCGRFAPDVCAAYQASAATGEPTPEVLALLGASSPARVLDRVRAPTLLLQGQADSLFPLSEADANARGIAAGGTPVKLVWYAGGHDGGQPETARLEGLTREWFGRYLKRDGSAPDTAFEVTSPVTPSLGAAAAPDLQVRSAPALPGVPATTTLPLAGPAQTALSPAGGSPAALTGLPGVGAALGTALGALGDLPLSDLPGQIAVFQTPVLTERLQVAGTPTVDLQISSSTGEATLFARLFDVSSDGSQALPQQLVAPIHLTGLPEAGRTVRVALPAVVLDLPAGHRLRVSLSSTDQAYAVPTEARAYRIGLVDDAVLTLPQVPTTRVGGSDTAPLLRIAAVLALVVVLGAVGLLVQARRRRHDAPDESLTAVPVAIVGLGKRYQGGYRAVSELSFRVEPGQVLGLLGPNGAGKTTTLRMLMGLILPTEGHITVFGHRIRPGAPVLSRVGAFIEGPGFLPHLSGRDNLELFWRATGRPTADAHLDTALEVAGLGDDVQRRVKTYSQGMRQRLAIAQAMLGLPELLVLDEPTNGLDPPQIREMREVLASYAATGRTVVVSSHLLAEVEQTCSHVVVMHRGRLVAEGPVAELVGSATAVVVDVSDPARAALVAHDVPGAQDIEVTGTGITLRLVGTPRADLVRALVAAGLDIDRLAPQRGLEEAFLALVGEQP